MSTGDASPKIGYIEVTPRGRIIGGGVASKSNFDLPDLAGVPVEVQNDNERIELDNIVPPSTLLGRAWDFTNEEVLPESELTAEFSDYTISVEEEATITLPADTIINVSGPLEATETHPGGVFTFASEVPGTYHIFIDAMPYKPRVYLIEVTI
jgi:hypothetical protein